MQILCIWGAKLQIRTCRQWGNELILASYAEMERQLPAELKDIEFEFRYDVASLFDNYKFFNVSKFAEEAGINSSLMRQYKSGNQYISEKQMLKIEEALHKIAREFAEIKLV